jgi:hypothetical protein
MSCQAIAVCFSHAAASSRTSIKHLTGLDSSMLNNQFYLYNIQYLLGKSNM